MEPRTSRTGEWLLRGMLSPMIKRNHRVPGGHRRRDGRLPQRQETSRCRRWTSWGGSSTPDPRPASIKAVYESHAGERMRLRCHHRRQLVIGPELLHPGQRAGRRRLLRHDHSGGVEHGTDGAPSNRRTQWAQPSGIIDPMDAALGGADVIAERCRQVDLEIAVDNCSRAPTSWTSGSSPTTASTDLGRNARFLRRTLTRPPDWIERLCDMMGDEDARSPACRYAGAVGDIVQQPAV